MILQNFLRKARRFLRRDDGASAIEYALLVAMVAVVLVLFVTPLGGAVWDKFDSVTTSLGGTSPGGKPVP